MKITFFGTSHGVPQKNRKCTCIMLTVGENRYFFDMGALVVDELIKKDIPISSIKVVFISHMHGDHTQGLVQLVDIADWYYKEYGIKYFLPRQSGIDALRTWIGANRIYSDNWKLPLKAEMIAYENGVIFEDENVKVTALKNQHIDESYAFLIEAEGKRVIYTGDLKDPQIDFPTEFLKETVDFAICESVHFSTEKYASIFKNTPPKVLCVNHFDDKKIDEIKENLKEFNLVIPNDDSEFEI